MMFHIMNSKVKISKNVSGQTSSPGTPPVFIVRLIERFRNMLRIIRIRTAPPRVILLEKFTGFWHTQMLYAAARLGLAELLHEKPRDLAELSELTGADPDSLKRLLRALTCVDVFSLDRGGLYRNNSISDCLRADHPETMKDMILMNCSQWHWNAWGKFYDSLLSGRTAVEEQYGKGLFELLGSNPEDGGLFGRAMSNLTSMSAPAIASSFNFSSVDTVCDLGGGRGTLLLQIMRAHPGIQGVLLDVSVDTGELEAGFQSEDISGRFKTIEGDFNESVPGEMDVYLMKFIIHDWADEPATQIMKNCARVMTSGTRLLLVEAIVPETPGLSFAKLLDLEIKVLTPGKERTRAEYVRLGERAGLALKRVIPLPGPESIMVFEKAG